MNVSEKFNECLALLVPLLKSYGFSRRSQNFYTRRDENWGVINFQKSMFSTKDRIKFQVNLGIYSTVLAKFFHKWKPGPPPFSRCHWRAISAFLLPDQGHWWVIDETTELLDLVKEFREILPLAVSRIESYITDEALRDLLLSGDCAGFTNHVRLEHLSVLIKRYGPFEILDFVLAELRNSGVDHVVEGHIERLKGLESI